MLKLFFLSVLTFTLSCFAGHNSIRGLDAPDQGRPFAEDGFLVPQKNPPLTAEDVNSGEWKPSEDGGCDLEKGCPYVNKDGLVRYLPSSEKAKLKKKESQTAKLKKEIGPIKASELASQLKKVQESGIKKVIVAYGDELTCPHCRDLGDALRRTLANKNDVTFIKVNKVALAELPDPTRKVIPQMKVMKWDGENWVEGFKRASFPEHERTDIISRLME